MVAEGFAHTGGKVNITEKERVCERIRKSSGGELGLQTIGAKEKERDRKTAVLSRKVKNQKLKRMGGGWKETNQDLVQQKSIKKGVVIFI